MGRLAEKLVQDMKKSVARNILEQLYKSILDDNLSIIDFLKIDIETVRIIEQFKSKESTRLLDSACKYVEDDLRFDSSKFENTVKIISTSIYDRNLQDQALKLKAPAVMMKYFFGMHSPACSERRRMLNISISSGKVRALTEREEHDLFLVWDKYKNENESIETFIAISEESGVGLDKIWTVYNNKGRSRMLLEFHNDVIQNKKMMQA